MTEEPGGLLATLHLDGSNALTETNEVYTVMTDPTYKAQLVINRVVTIAVPVPVTANIVSSGTTILKGTWNFDFDECFAR